MSAVQTILTGNGPLQNLHCYNLDCVQVNGAPFPPPGSLLYQNPASTQVTGDLLIYDTLANEVADSGVHVNLTNINCATKSLQNVTNLNGTPVSTLVNTIGSVSNGQVPKFNGSGSAVVGSALSITSDLNSLNVPGYVQTNELQSSVPSTGSLTFNGSGETQINWNGGYLMWLRQYNVTCTVPFICNNIENTYINNICSSNINKYTVPSVAFPTIQSAINDINTNYIANGPQTIYVRNGTYTENLDLKQGVTQITGESQSACIINGNATMSGVENYSFANLTFSTTSGSAILANFLPHGLPKSITFNNTFFVDASLAGGATCIGSECNTQINCVSCSFLCSTNNNSYIAGVTNGSLSFVNCNSVSNGQGTISVSYASLICLNSVLNTQIQMGDGSGGGIINSVLTNTLDMPLIATSGGNAGNFLILDDNIYSCPNATTDHYLVNTQSGLADHTYNIQYNVTNNSIVTGVVGRYLISGSNLLLTTITQMTVAP